MVGKGYLYWVLGWGKFCFLDLEEGSRIREEGEGRKEEGRGRRKKRGRRRRR